jgi:elongation factor G
LKVYSGSAIRNIAITGHSNSGKTSLVNSLLATAGAAEFGSSPTVYDEEEIARDMTLANSVAWLEWNATKINLLDTPGFTMFVHEAKCAMVPVESTLVIADAVAGVEAMTTRVWHYADEFNLPRVLLVNGMDRDRADGASTLDALQATYGRQVAAVQLPIGNGKDFRGVVDLVTMRAYTYTTSSKGRGTVGDIPASLADDAQAAHEALVELVAEGKDELMEEYFREGTIPEAHLITALHEAIREDRIFPVLYASSAANIATDHLLDFFEVYMPAASERLPVAARAAIRNQVPVAAGANGHAESGNGHANGHSNGHSNGHANDAPSGNSEMLLRPVEDSQPLSLYVFKTISDPFAGHISFFKVFSGVLKSDATVQNFSRNTAERFSHIALMRGKTATEVTELHAGDIGAVPKLKATATGDTLGDKSSPIFFEPVQLPEPAITFAIEPKTRADEDKLANGLHRLMEEDTLVRFFRDPQTGEFLIAGAGQQHIEVLVSKLKKRYHTEVTLKAPKVPYRETIRGKAEAQGRHKKQTGGHGQFGDCKIRMEPLPHGAGFQFVNDIFGGAIPRNFVPAVEKGIQETAVRGYLAGFPVVDYKVTLIDGSYHDVDSNELSFKLAGRLAFRKCMEQARPAILEPIMRVEIEAPEEFAGALMGDLNSRRGRVQGMDRTAAANTFIKAEVPMAEMLTYGADLTAMTQGRGSFHMEMDHYDYVPPLQQEKIIAASKASGKTAVDDDE